MTPELKATIANAVDALLDAAEKETGFAERARLIRLSENLRVGFAQLATQYEPVIIDGQIIGTRELVNGVTVAIR